MALASRLDPLPSVAGLSFIVDLQNLLKMMRRDCRIETLIELSQVEFFHRFASTTDLSSSRAVDDVGRDDLVGDKLLEEELPRLGFAVAGGHAVHRGVVRVRDRGVVLQGTVKNEQI